MLLAHSQYFWYPVVSLDVHAQKSAVAFQNLRNQIQLGALFGDAKKWNQRRTGGSNQESPDSAQKRFQNVRICYCSRSKFLDLCKQIALWVLGEYLHSIPFKVAKMHTKSELKHEVVIPTPQKHEIFHLYDSSVEELLIRKCHFLKEKSMYTFKGTILTPTTLDMQV